MRDFRSVVTSAFVALAAWTATVNPLQAETGTVRVLFGTTGVVVGVGNGKGTLTFHEDLPVRGFRCEFRSHAGANRQRVGRAGPELTYSR
jgi:hypothetical protein